MLKICHSDCTNVATESLFAQKLRRSTSEPVLPLVEVSASKLPEPTKTASSALFLAKNKTFSSIAPHHTIPSARNPFAQESDNKKRKESSAPPTPGRGRGGKKAKRSDAFADLPNVAEVEEDQLAPTPMPETNGAVDYEEANIKVPFRSVSSF